MKKPIFFVGLFIFSLLMSSTSVPLSAHNADPSAIHMAYYDVSATNTTGVYTWYNANYTESYNYHVDNGSTINVTLFDPTEFNTELNITVGNLTRHHINDAEAAEALGLGYYKVSSSFGFISSTNWTEIDTAMKALNFSEYSFSSSFQYQFGAAKFEAVNYTFSDGFQSTSLVYEKASGLLYHADVVVGNFVLSFSITGYDAVEDDVHDVVSSSSDTGMPINMVIPFILTFMLVTYFRKEKHQ